MKALFQIEQPDDIDFTLQLTMPLKQWKELQRQLASAYPSWELYTAINSVVNQAQQNFSPEGAKG